MARNNPFFNAWKLCGSGNWTGRSRKSLSLLQDAQAFTERPVASSLTWLVVGASGWELGWDGQWSAYMWLLPVARASMRRYPEDLWLQGGSCPTVPAATFWKPLPHLYWGHAGRGLSPDGDRVWQRRWAWSTPGEHRTPWVTLAGGLPDSPAKPSLKQPSGGTSSHSLSAVRTEGPSKEHCTVGKTKQIQVSLCRDKSCRWHGPFLDRMWWERHFTSGSLGLQNPSPNPAWK